MTLPEQICLALALAACAGVNCYLIALLLAVGSRLDWPGMAAFEPLAPTGFMVAVAVLFLVEFVLDKVPRVNLWWGWPQLLVRPLAGALVAALALGGAGGGAVIGAVGAGLSVALALHLGRTRLRRALNRSPEPFSNVAASLAGDAAVVLLFTLAMRVPLVAGSAGLVLAATGAAFALGCCGRGAPAGAPTAGGAPGADGSSADHDEAHGVEP